jgi:putative copper export protein
MNLLPFFEWMEALAFSAAIRESAALSSVFNLIHLLAIVVLVGGVLIVDLRLLGSGLTRQPVSQIARDARPWVVGALVVLLLSGIPQLTSTAMKQYYSPFFWQKMSLLVVVLLYTFTIRHRVTQAEEGRIGPAARFVVGLVSIALWTGIAVNGRLIGLLS